MDLYVLLNQKRYRTYVWLFICFYFILADKKSSTTLPRYQRKLRKHTTANRLDTQLYHFYTEGTPIISTFQAFASQTESNHTLLIRHKTQESIYRYLCTAFKLQNKIQFMYQYHMYRCPKMLKGQCHEKSFQTETVGV